MNRPTNIADIPASIREQIVLAAIDALQLDGLTVYRERPRPLEKETLPAIVVYCGDDIPANIGSNYAAPLTERHLDLVFEARATGSTDIPADQALDPLLTWISYAIFQDTRFNGLANDCFEKQTLAFTREGEQLIASAARTITIKYRTSRLDPTSKT